MYLVYNKVMINDCEVARFNKVCNGNNYYHCIGFNNEYDYHGDDLVNILELFKEYTK